MKVTDPVCGMQIDAEKAVAQEDYVGQRFFFCSVQCHRLFKTSPERYVGRGRQSEVDPDSKPESEKDRHE